MPDRKKDTEKMPDDNPSETCQDEADKTSGAVTGEDSEAEQNISGTDANMNSALEGKTVIKPMRLDKKGVHSQSIQDDEQADKATVIVGLPAQGRTEPEPEQTGIKADLAHGKNMIGTGSLLKGRFELFEELGSGGMGVVYKALDRRDVEAGNTSFIAIKLLNEEYRSNPDVLKALHSEARKTQQLAHPNILTVYDFDRDGEQVFMTMEYINGITLERFIRSHPHGVSLKEALPIIEQLAQALAYAHKNFVIHSDFKPGNIFIDQNNRVKVLDFGIARSVSLGQTSRFDAGVLGALTPAYASLEMLQGDMPDPRDDIYAFACVIYELLTGKHPFTGHDAQQAKSLKQAPETIKSLNSRQWRALRKALSFEREQRTKTIEALIQGLHARSYKRVLFAAGLAGVIGMVVLLQVFGLISLLPEKEARPGRQEGNITDSNAHNIAKLEKPVYKPLIPPKQETAPPDLKGKSFSESRPIEPPSLDKDKQANVRHADDDKARVAGKIKLWTEKKIYRIGDNLQVGFSVDRPMFVRVVLINAVGEITELFPNPYQKDNFCQPGVDYHVPPAESELALTIMGPSGVDKIRAVAMEKPFPFEVLRFSRQGRLLAKSGQIISIGEADYMIR